MADNTVRITLDGKTITQQQLTEAQSNPSIKIIEVGPNSYKTLQRLQG